MKKWKEGFRSLAKAAMFASQLMMAVTALTAGLDLIRYGEIMHQLLMTIEVGALCVAMTILLLSAIIVLFIEEHFE